VNPIPYTKLAIKLLKRKLQNRQTQTHTNEPLKGTLFSINYTRNPYKINKAHSNIELSFPDMCSASGYAVKKRKPLIKSDKATTLSYSMPGTGIN